MYKVELTAQARRSLNKVPEKIAQAIMAFIYGPLAENPYRVGKMLTGPYSGFRAARRSSYRIIYEIFDERLTVDNIKIAHRADAYR